MIHSRLKITFTIIHAGRIIIHQFSYFQALIPLYGIQVLKLILLSQNELDFVFGWFQISHINILNIYNTVCIYIPLM